MNTLSKRKLTTLIYLAGIKPCGYRVITNGFMGCANEIDVPCVAIGNAMVKALRALAAKPDADRTAKDTGETFQKWPF